MKIVVPLVMLFIGFNVEAKSELAKPTLRTAKFESIKDCSAFRDFARAPVGSSCVDGKNLKFKTTKEVRTHTFTPVSSTLGIPNDSCALSVKLGGCVHWLCDNGAFKTCEAE